MGGIHIKHIIKKEVFNVVLIIAPLIYGAILYYFNPPVHSIVLMLVFSLYWFWVGMCFAKLRLKKWIGLIYGNSLWLISMLAYIYLFILIELESRNFELAVLSQLYVYAYIWPAFQAIMLLPTGLNFNAILFLAYFFMLVVFLTGFIIQAKMKRH
jgi:hypothetical protein